MEKPESIVLENTERGIAWLNPVTHSKQEFEHTIRSVRLDVQELRVIRTLSEGSNDIEPNAQLRPYLSGQAILEDRSIQVIGYPDTKFRTLSIGFHLLRQNNPVETEDPAKTAYLGFSSADWEIGTGDEWWLSLYLSQPQLDDLAKSFQAGQIAKLSVSLELPQLYTTSFYSPVSERIDWYIAPSNPTSRNCCVTGTLKGLALETATLDLRPPATVEPEPSFEPDVPKAPPEAAITTAIEALTAKVNGLQGSATLIGWALVALAFITWLKG